MRKFKKAAAMGLAAAMLMGNATVAFATEGGATGNGNYEGYVEETSVFSVEVPTDASATKGFDFFVDPNGLLAATDYARISGVTAADFEENATLFFERTPVAAAEGVEAVTKYGKDSESITFSNKSSYAVNVEVSAAVTGADGITLGAVTDETTAPTIYLALVTPGENAAVATPITSTGAKVTGNIAGENSNFEVVYKEADESAGTEAGYYYVQKTASDDSPLAPWKTYSFNLTGACGGTWTAAQAEVEPRVTLTWKVTDPAAGPSVSGSLSTSNKTVSISGLGDGVTLKSASIIKTDETSVAMTSGTHYTFSAGRITILKDALVDNASYKEWVLTFSDNSTVRVPIVAAQ